MIPIERLHYKLDMRLNKLASNEHQQIPVEDKDFALNEAQIKLIKRKINPNINYGSGFDGFRKLYQDLEFLATEHESIAASKGVGPISLYKADLSTLTHKFFLPIDIFTACTRELCKGRIVWIETMAKHSDVPVMLSSTHHQPSFAHQATFAVISSGNLLVYTEDPKGAFSVEEVHISYLRLPIPVCFGGYEDFDGSMKIKADCEFPEHLEDEILDIAEEDLALSTENQFAAQAAQLRAKEANNPNP